MTSLLRRLARLLMLCLVLCGLPGWLVAAPLTLTPDMPQQYPGTIGLLEWRTTPETTLEQVLKTSPDDWTPVGHRAVTRQYSRDAHWFRIDVHNADQGMQWFLDLDWPLLDSIDVYLLGEDQQLIKHWHTGDRLPFSQRPIPASSFTFPLPAHEARYEVLLRIHTSSQFYVTPSIFRDVSSENGHQYYQRERNTSLFLHSLFFGAMSIMILYNLFILRETREHAYIAYVCFCLSVTLFHATLQGWGYQYLWPEMPWVQSVAYPLFATLSYFFATAFIMLFLETTSMPFWHATGRYLLCVWSVFLYLSLVIEESAFTIGSLPVIAACIVLSIVVPIEAYRRGKPQAIIFALAWALPLLGTLANLLMQNGILEASHFTVFGGQALGVAMETVLISLALSYRLKRLQKDEEHARSEAIRYQQQHAEMLEERIRLRLHELESTRSAVDATLRRLSGHEKDSVLGLLLNSVSQQMQSPTLMIDTHISALNAAQRDFDTYIQSLLTEADEDLRSLFIGILHELSEAAAVLSSGSERIGEITRSLSVDDYFSSLKAVTSLSDLTRQALNRLQQDYPAVTAQWQTNADCRVPVHADAFAVALDAILRNACQALPTGATAPLLLSLTTDKDHAVLTIEDHGTGMTSDIVHRMFDPFFTTREVGAGKGMGLSLAREILRRHGGNIHCVRSSPQGTVMALRIPL
jgi:signal transduction histidine kinase